MIGSKYANTYVFNRIISSIKIPYNFDQFNKVWWRWYSDIFGFYYDRIKRSYSIWLTIYLKNNIGVYMPFLFKMPGKKNKILDNWGRCAFLYEKTLLKKQLIFFSIEKKINLNFWTIDYKSLSEPAKNILLINNRQHRQIGSHGFLD